MLAIDREPHRAKYQESGEAYKAARKASGLTQEQLAEIVGITRRHLIRVEKGENRPYPRLRDRIAEALKVDPSSLPAVGDPLPFRRKKT